MNYIMINFIMVEGNGKYKGKEKDQDICNGKNKDIVKKILYHTLKDSHLKIIKSSIINYLKYGVLDYVDFNFTYKICKNLKIIEHNLEEMKQYTFILVWIRLLYNGIWCNKEKLLGVPYLNKFITRLFGDLKRFNKLKLIYTSSINTHTMFKRIEETKVFPKLYKRDKKGKIREWNIRIKSEDDGGAIITVTYGIQRGKMISKVTVVRSGKNIGKSNETTPYIQSYLNAVSIFKKRLKSGYATSEDEADEKLLIPHPMLAHDWHKNITPPFPLVVQPKYDGVRCMGRYVRGKIEFYTRGGENINNFPKINETVKKWYKDNNIPHSVWTDGELYSHGMPLQQITSAVNTSTIRPTHQKLIDKIEYYIFDMFDTNNLNWEYNDRRRYLSKILSTKNKLVRRVPTSSVDTMDRFQVLLQKYLSLKYEGAILRVGTGKYEYTRSKNIYKYKEKMVEEALIEDIIPIEKKDEGLLFKCYYERRDVRFELNGNGVASYRKKILLNKNKYIGQYIRFYYNDHTEAGVPKFTRPVIENNRYVIFIKT